MLGGAVAIAQAFQRDTLQEHDARVARQGPVVGVEVDDRTGVVAHRHLRAGRDLPGLRLLHEGQLEGARRRVPVQLARGVVRSELAQRPELIAQVAADAIDALVLSARHAVLEVHPQDRALLAQDLAERLGTRGVRLQDNPAIARGGCRLQADVADVDARIEQRWQAAAQALGSALPWADEAAAS